MRKLRTRIGVGAAITTVAAVAAITIASTADASTTVQTDALTSAVQVSATATAHSTLSISAAKTSILVGQQDNISGTLKASGRPAAKKAVQLSVFNSKLQKWQPTGSKLTSADGEVTFTVKPDVTSKYELTYLGSPALAASHSGAVTIVVKTATKLSVAASPTAVKTGRTTEITGVLSANAKPAAGEAVWLDQYNATTKKWVPVTAGLTSKKGGVSFSRKLSATTTFELVFLGTPTLAGTHSGAVTVAVR